MDSESSEEEQWNKSYYIPQKVKIKLTQPDEKIINFFTSPNSLHSFLLTKINNKFNIYGFGANYDGKLGIHLNTFIPTIIDYLKKIKIKNIYCGECCTFVLDSFFFLF